MRDLGPSAQASFEALLARRDVAIGSDVIADCVDRRLWSERSAIDVLDDHVRGSPDAIALVDESGHRRSFRQLDEATDAIARNLIAHGFEPGDCLALRLPNWSEFFLAMLGAIKARVLTVNLHLTYRAHELTGILARTAAKGIVLPSTSPAAGADARARHRGACVPRHPESLPFVQLLTRRTASRRPILPLYGRTASIRCSPSSARERPAGQSSCSTSTTRSFIRASRTARCSA